VSAFQRLLYALYWYLWALTKPRKYRTEYNWFRASHNKPLLIQAYLWANIKYRKDTKPWHEWQPAMKTWEIGEGDCEDWAILACDCLYEWNKCYYLCMYTADSGHATLLISKKEKEYDVECLWLSVGTFGLEEHGGTIQDLVTDWSGFENWTMAVLMDDRLDVLEVYYN